jgi:hypothetical protein
LVNAPEPVPGLVARTSHSFHANLAADGSPAGI